MWPDRVSNPGPLAYESDVLLTEPCGMAVKWWVNRAKVDKILFILAILYKSLYMVFGSGGSDETGWKLGLLVFSGI